MSNNNFVARLYPNPSDHTQLTINALTGGTRSTPGNVGLCLSGGGSRALTSGMGQLRALAQLKTSDGKSLLDQVKAISTVSGGSWLGITFEFQDIVEDAAYLNASQPAPADLTKAGLEILPQGCIASNVTKDFSLIDIAVQALFYRIFSRTPSNMLWQTVIGKHILAPYKLYESGKHQTPTQAFSYNSDVVGAILDLPNQNAALSNVSFSVLRDADRPYFICNTSMFVDGADPRRGDYQYLAPVQCTPFFTGIVGSPSGKDASGKIPGGGGVTSFAFNSTLTETNAEAVTISEARPWSVVDIVGASSAAFAETIVNLFADWKEHPDKMMEVLHGVGQKALDKVTSDLEKDEHAKAEKWLSSLLSIDHKATPIDKLFDKIEAEVAQHAPLASSLHTELERISIADIVPSYYYWPVINATAETIKPTQFADGGNLENTGIASLLSYSDIDNVIACVNSPSALKPSAPSTISPTVLFNQSTKVITTTIEVDSQIPPLFGYQAFSNGTYTPYEGNSVDKANAWGVHNQIFNREDFTAFLTGLWTAANGSKSAAVYSQTLAVKANEWFGVPERESITCVWVYTSPASDWKDLLNEDVKKALADISNFPNYETFNTELTPAEINLLSSLTTWCVSNETTRQMFIDLFRR